MNTPTDHFDEREWRLQERALRDGLRGLSRERLGGELLKMSGSRNTYGGDVAVFPGDILVGDDDAVIVIPAGIAAEVADEAVEMTAYEDFVVERVKAGEPIIGLYPCTKDEHQTAFRAWRAANGR